MIGVVRAAQNRQLQQVAEVTVGTTAGQQSYTLPSGTQYIDIELFGGGGAGGRGHIVSVGRTYFYTGGGGGGGGAYVRHGLTAFGGDVLNFIIGSGGTANHTGLTPHPGGSGGNTSLLSLTRSGETIFSLSNVIAYGGFGGSSSTTISMIPQGGTGGKATGGNISNRDAGNGNNGGLTSTTTANGGNGGAGGDNDVNAADQINIQNGGGAGIATSNTHASVGSNSLIYSMGAGGGGGGYNKNGADGNGIRGATGGLGGIKIKAYG
jgi:hypothetical protein